LINKRGSFWKPHFDILDEARNPILKIQGPCCIWDGACCSCENNFEVYTSN